MADSAIDLFNRVGEIDDAAQATGLRPELLHAVMHQESGGRAGAVSSKGAVGPLQVMPQTARDPGLGVKPFDPSDPHQNITGGAQYLKALINHYGGDETKALAAYNAGMGRVDKAGGVPNIPETQNYVQNITARAGKPQSAIDLFNSAEAPPPQTAEPSAPAPDNSNGLMADWGQSAKHLYGGLYHAVTNPTETIQNTAKLGAGLAQKMVGKENLDKAISVLDPRKVLPASFSAGTLPSGQGNDLRPVANAVIDDYKNKYGSVANAGHTALHDPFGTAMDASMLLEGGGGALNAAGKATKVDALARAGQLASKAGAMVDPIRGAGNVASAVVQKPAAAVAEHVANVNLQIPKALRRRELNSPFTPAQAVLNENRGFTSNPFTRFSEGGLNKAQATSEKLTGKYNDLLNADAQAGHKYPIDTVDQVLADEQARVAHDVNAQPKQAAIQTVRDNFKTNPLYSKDVMGSGPMVSQTIQVPEQTPLGGTVYRTKTIQVPGPQVPVGREFIPQSAPELDVMKRNVDKGLTFGERGGTLEEALKAARSQGIDKIIDENVPGADVLNQRRSRNAVANKALQDAVLGRQTKRGIGFAEAMLPVASAAAASGHPLFGGLAALPWAYNTMVKHPWLSSPVATAAHFVGKSPLPQMGTNLARAAAPSARASQEVNDTARVYPVTKDRHAEISDILNTP